MTLAELARELGISPKTLRAWLRSRIERGADTGRRIPRPSASLREKRNRDQDYVADLCDEVLGERALREHRFDWLRGDPGKDGKARALPVDAYYPQHGLVVEYRERQHMEPVPHFDKPDVITVSGVHRGEQRKMYDLRREREIPKHGLRLVVVPFDALDHDARGRLRRSRDADIAVIFSLLER